ncbi:MAG: GWxTD domain-containing protein [Balneolaceae bacterium]|nr:GWxTD domain-containing protein [Balneolaceae bacterium]
MDRIDRGQGYSYEPGFPEVRLSTTGYVDLQDNTKIIVSGSIVYGSLIYKKAGDLYRAKVNVDIEIINRADPDQKALSLDYNYSLDSENENIINSQEVYRFEQEYDVSPGDYLIRVVVTDLNSEKQTVREAQSSIPDPQGKISKITEIRVLGKNSSQQKTTFKPVNTYDIPSKLDSLQFIFQVTNNKEDEQLTLQARLLRFESDTTIARKMNYNNYSPSHISYKGIDYGEYKVVQSSRRVLNQSGSVLIEFTFTDLKRGNYRLEVLSEKEDDDLYKARDFSVKSKNYPALKTPRELARPLYYLMGSGTYKKMMSIKSSDSLKSFIDRFWLANIGNSARAREVISKYYQRVESANKQFSNYKEGWKTDMGMIYILFGPPWYTTSFSDEMLWSYSYNRMDPEKNFLFKRTKLKSKFFPFLNYLLDRKIEYNSLYYNQSSKWRNGLILRDNL